jgi:hypothetical protein
VVQINIVAVRITIKDENCSSELSACSRSGEDLEE